MEKLFMTQTEAANYIGVTTATILRWERAGFAKREELPGVWYTKEGLPPLYNPAREARIAVKPTDYAEEKIDENDQESSE